MTRKELIEKLLAVGTDEHEVVDKADGDDTYFNTVDVILETEDLNDVIVITVTERG